jgi:phage-related protein
MLIFFRPFGDFLASILRPMARGLLKMSRDWLKWTKGSTEEKLTSIMDTLKSRIDSIFLGVKITDLIGGAVSIWNFISDASKSIWDFVSPVLKPIWDFVSDVAKDIWTWVTDASKSIWDFIDTSFKSIWDFVTTSTKPIWEFIVSEMRPIWFWITDVSKSMWTWVTDVARDIWYWITNISKSIWDWITTEVKSVWDFIITPIRSIWDFITGGGSNWGGGGGGSTVKDFIWRPGQAPQSISSTDTVVGTKSKNMGLGSVSINLGGINIEKVSSDYDIKRIGDLVADQIIIKLRSMT